MKRMTDVRINEWVKIRERLETESTANMVLSLNHYDSNPLVEVIKCFILGFGSTVYSNAYSLDNPTRLMYVQNLRQLMRFDRYTSSEDRFRLQEALKNVPKIMPRGFRNCFIEGNSFWVNEKPLTIKKANEFLDWLNSQGFEDILIKNFQNSTSLILTLH